MGLARCLRQAVAVGHQHAGTRVEAQFVSRPFSLNVVQNCVELMRRIDMARSFCGTNWRIFGSSWNRADAYYLLEGGSHYQASASRSLEA
jgi:hypothetical protein